MKQIIYFKDFYRAFQRTRPESFSDGGLYELYHHLEEDPDMVFDCIDICRAYSEGCLTEVLRGYGMDSLEELQEITWAVLIGDDSVIYQNY